MAAADIQDSLRKADELYNQQKFREAADLLEPLSAESEDVELIWRVMRLYYRLGKAASDKAEGDAYALKAYELSAKGLKINENTFGIQKVISLHTPRTTSHNN